MYEGLAKRVHLSTVPRVLNVGILRYVALLHAVHASASSSGSVRGKLRCYTVLIRHDIR